MGKASRKKRERKIAITEQEEKQKSITKKKTKKKKITVAALEKKAKAVNSALKRAVNKAETVVAKKESEDSFQKIKIDPQKLENFKKESKVALKKGAYILISIISIVSIILVLELHSAGRTLPGTSVASIDVGYMNVDKAKEKLQTEIDKYIKTPITFVYKGKSTELQSDKIEFNINTTQTIDRLPVIDFKRENPINLSASLFSNKKTTLVYSIDVDKTINLLEENLNLKDKKAQNARIVYSEEAFTITPEKEGIAINRAALIGALKNNISNLSKTPITVELIPQTPRVTKSQIEQEKDKLIEKLNLPLILEADNNKTTIKLIDHLDAVWFKEQNYFILNENTGVFPIVLNSNRSIDNDGSSKIQSSIKIDIDVTKLKELIQEDIINKVEAPVSPANLYTNENGDVIIEGTGEDGKSVAINRLAQTMVLAVNNGITTVPVPILIDKAPLTISDDLKEKGIKDLIATGHSSYYGSPGNRMFNISFGTEKYNGMLIAPGTEFSFNELLGNVDSTSGFKPEKVIKENKLKLEYGGGICQVSTTLYRAALLAGLPITQRKPHSWKVSYYGQSMGHGLDATIYPGVADLRFMNDTPGDLLIQAYTIGAEDYFKIYGTADGRVTNLEGPYGGGLTYRWHRTVTHKGETTIDEDIWSRYVPIPAPEPPKPKPEPRPESVNNGF